MGIFESISKIALTPSAFIAEKYLKVVKPSSVKSTSQLASEAASTTFGKVLGTSIAATAVAIPIALFPGAALTGVKAVGRTAAKHPIKTGLGVAVGVPMLASSPKLVSGIFSAGKELPSFGTGLGGVIEGKKTIGEFLTEHPILSTAAAVVGVAAVGKVAAPVIGGALAGRKKVAIIQTESQTPVATGGLTGTSPILPQTQAITTGKRRYKRRTAKKTPSVRQSVRVNIINKPRATGMRIYNKRYINQPLLN